MQIRLIFFFSAFVTLAIVHIAAMEFFLYWKYLWLDIPVHILGGIVAAFGVSILPFIHVHLLEAVSPLKATMLAVVCVGVAWEVFEIGAGISPSEPGFIFDTSLDLVMDIFGGVLGYGVIQSVKQL